MRYIFVRLLILPAEVGILSKFTSLKSFTEKLLAELSPYIFYSDIKIQVITDDGFAGVITKDLKYQIILFGSQKN